MSEFDNPEIFRSILETLPTGVYLVDRYRKILFWNDGAEEITGYLRQDVVGRFLRDHLLTTNSEIDKDLDSDPIDPLGVAFRDGKPTSGHVSILHKEGYRIPIVLQTVPIRNVKGVVIGAAECFERNFPASKRTRRQVAMAESGSLDEVTGVPNRNYMETRVRENLMNFRERRAVFSILVVQADQLDHFRSTCGPGVVPAILRVVAQTVANSLRPTDIVGCWSENQFLALLTECKGAEVGRVGERLRKIVAQSEIEWWGDVFSLTAAFGGTGCREGDTLELLLERAERSLTESIGAGGNRMTVLP